MIRDEIMIRFRGIVADPGAFSAGAFSVIYAALLSDDRHPEAAADGPGAAAAAPIPEPPPGPLTSWPYVADPGAPAPAPAPSPSSAPPS